MASKVKVTTTTKRVRKVPKGSKRCPNCGGDGVVEIRSKKK